MISRRSFLKCSGIGLSTTLLPNFALSKLSSNDVSVLEIFLYGGASSAVSEAKLLKDENISGYNNVTLTTNGFWQEAGGDHLETLLTNSRLSLFSLMPWHTSKAHGFCQDYGILGQANLLEQDTDLIAIGNGGKALVGRHKGYISTDANFSNPFDKGDLAKQINSLYAGLSSKPHLEQLTAAANLEKAKAIRDTYIAGYGDSDIGKQIASTLSYMQAESSTVYASIPYGGWDMHSNAFNNYTSRMSGLLAALVQANTQIEQQNKPIVIVIHGDFGRNYYVNNSNGWDHGDHQIAMLVGGQGAINHLGKAFESTINKDSPTRLYTKPSGNYKTLDPIELRAFVLETLGVSLNDAVTKVKDSSYLWSLDFEGTANIAATTLKQKLDAYASL